MDDLVQAMGGTGMSKSKVGRLCEEIGERVDAFLARPIESEWPCLRTDVTYPKVRQGGRIVSVYLSFPGRLFSLAHGVWRSREVWGRSVLERVRKPDLASVRSAEGA